MTAFMKKQGVAFYFNVVSAVAGIVALIAMISSSTMSDAYKLNAFPMMVVGTIAGILLIGLGIFGANRNGNYEYISTASQIGAIVLFSAVIGGMILDRVLLISGLFSWNSGNTIGWSVFYASAVSLVAFLISIVLLIIGSFLKSVK